MLSSLCFASFSLCFLSASTLIAFSSALLIFAIFSFSFYQAFSTSKSLHIFDKNNQSLIVIKFFVEFVENNFQ